MPDEYNERFVGTLEYSAENGLLLSYTIPKYEVPRACNVLYGVLTDGQKCSLYGEFSPGQSGFTLQSGLTVRQGKSYFLYLLLGEHLPNDRLIFEINFSLTNLQEFFFPGGHKDLVRYSTKPLLAAQTNFGMIEVGNDAKFRLLNRDLSTQIFSPNDSALRELKDAFDTIQQNHIDSLFLLKEDIAYRISLKFDHGASIVSAYKYIRELSNLFAVLICSPVYPESIRIPHQAEDGSKSSIVMYPSMVINKRTVEMCTKSQSHFHMPITNAKIDLPSILSKWLECCERYKIIISSIQSETGFRHEHSLHGEIVLYATQLEGISYEASVRDKKYEYPLESHAIPQVKEGVEKIFLAAGEDSVGRGISDLRNEISHVKKTRKLLTAISMTELARLSRYLQITILGYVLENIGIEKDLIANYQEHFMPQTP